MFIRIRDGNFWSQDFIREDHEVVHKYFRLLLLSQDNRVKTHTKYLTQCYNSLIKLYTSHIKNDECSEDEINNFLTEEEDFFEEILNLKRSKNFEKLKEILDENLKVLKRDKDTLFHQYIIFNIVVFLKEMLRNHCVPQAITQQFLSKFLNYLYPWNKAKNLLSLFEKKI